MALLQFFDIYIRKTQAARARLALRFYLRQVNGFTRPHILARTRVATILPKRESADAADYEAFAGPRSGG